MSEPDHEVSELLRAWGSGDLDARDRLLPLVYRELRRRAAALPAPRAGETTRCSPRRSSTRPTCGWSDQRRAAWQNRGQFFAAASQMMRRILVDRARARRVAKRSGTLGPRHPRRGVAGGAGPSTWTSWTWTTRSPGSPPSTRARAGSRSCGSSAGCRVEETAEALGVSLATVERDWQAARAWLFKIALDAAVTPDRWRQITETFHAALAREGEARQGFVAEACGADVELRAEVEALLLAQSEAGSFGERPLFEPGDVQTLRPGRTDPGDELRTAEAPSPEAPRRPLFAWLLWPVGMVALAVSAYAAFLLAHATDASLGWDEAPRRNADSTSGASPPPGPPTVSSSRETASSP